MIKKREQSIEKIKAEMITLIEDMELPVLFSRCEADGSYELVVCSSEAVVTGGYARDFLGKDILSLEELDIFDLAGIIIYGEKTTEDVIKEMEGECSEDED